jgi:hypothetical protein
MMAAKRRRGNRSSRWAGALKLCCGSGAGNGSPSITRDDPLDAAEIPPAKSPVLNFGVMISSMMRLAVTSVSAAFQAVADLDAQLAVVLGHHQQRAVVDLLAPDLPGFRDPDRILLDGFRRRGRHDQHRDLAAFPQLQSFQGLRQRGDGVAGQRAGLIDHPPRQRRHRDIGKGRESPAHQQRNKGGSCSDHRGQSVGESYLAGAGLKSTFGAVEISFSFSTVKLAFSL